MFWHVLEWGHLLMSCTCVRVHACLWDTSTWIALWSRLLPAGHPGGARCPVSCGSRAVEPRSAWPWRGRPTHSWWGWAVLGPAMLQWGSW